MLLYLEYFGYLTQERFKCVEFTENFQEWLDKDCFKGFLLFLHKNQIPGSSVISRCVTQNSFLQGVTKISSMKLIMLSSLQQAMKKPCFIHSLTLLFPAFSPWFRACFFYQRMNKKKCCWIFLLLLSLEL